MQRQLSVDWLTPELKLKDFGVFRSQDPGYMKCICVGELDGTEVHVELPEAFRNMSDHEWVDIIMAQAKAINRMDLGHELLKLALGEAIADKVMQDHGYLNTLTL